VSALRAVVVERQVSEATVHRVQPPEGGHEWPSRALWRIECPCIDHREMFEGLPGNRRELLRVKAVRDDMDGSRDSELLLQTRPETGRDAHYGRAPLQNVPLAFNHPRRRRALGMRITSPTVA